MHLELKINFFFSFYEGYHYQMKMHVFNRKQSDNADPTFRVKLYGAGEDTNELYVSS